MFLTERKLEARIQELSALRYRDLTPIIKFMTVEDDGQIGLYPPEIGNDHQEILAGDRWEGRDVYKWLQTTVLFPEDWRGKKLVGNFQFGRTGGGNNSGFESLLFVNNEPYQGVDSNHEEVIFHESLAGKEVSLSFRMWTGLEGGGAPQIQHYRLEQAEIGWLDETIDDLYYTALAMYQTIMELPETDHNRSTLITLLDQTFLLVDWTLPGSELFYDSCYQAHAFVKEELSKLDKNHPVTVHCVGHTHIDVAWLWRLKHTREKAARSFSTVLRLMEEYPDYLFLQSQPQLYEYIKNDYPAIYEKMKKRVEEGRWEAEGGMWLESDCNIPSGESLVRQILVGKQFLKKEFNVDCSILWLPDVFGYSWALPQILKKSGIDSFMTTKISWNQYNRMPHDTFYWKGMDGTEILTHFITTPEPWNAEDSWFYTYNGLITAKTVNGAWKGYRNKDVNKNLLLSYGYGDGGGGVNREMLELRRHLDDMPGIPHVKPGRAGDFFRELQHTVKNTKQYVHQWDGELYLEYHRGTYTSQAFMKRNNRKLELAFRSWEFYSVLESLQNGWASYPTEKLLEAWKILLRNQFHDIIPGSSIREVYGDAEVEYEEAKHLYQSHLKETSSALMKEQKGTYTLFNPTLWNHKQAVLIPFDEVNQEEGNFIDEEGQPLSAQKGKDGWWIIPQILPSFGGTKVSYRKTEPSRDEEQTPFSYDHRTLKTPFYEVKWNENGQIIYLYDKENNRRVLAEGAKGNLLQIFEDKPLAHDAWDIDLFYQEKSSEVNELQKIEVVENGPLRFAVEMQWNYHLSSITQRAVFYTHTRRIDFETHVDWHERRKLMKAAFPVDIRSTEATFDIQYGNVKRPTHWNTSWEMAKFETVGHQWADLSETGYGVSLLNDCKYGYDIKGNTLRLSLLKSSVYPDTEADQGEHVFTYSLYPHSGDWREGKTHQEAWTLNAPVEVFDGVLTLHKGSLLSSDHHHIHIDAVKKAEEADGIIVRLHEFEGRKGEVTLRSDFAWDYWQETDLMEVPLSDKMESSTITLDVSPYEIKTIFIKFQ
ncbi:alpha-mannosidase [Fictibacillus barbaricus]|uniref:Alpha-mannosidase n=1 Tax=Fictibacillus barbaricus TaxID=182136 RepID=A0ABS2ZEF1_9BACL|nr:alpha-mannosidase [Fictibacillus barbaricus]MBN3546558.1 alpha-mannosidase [Fictibacillus barbaricus]GGB41973.1 alpha-mannosidase [Fictibacillus barbaricus]